MKKILILTIIASIWPISSLSQEVTDKIEQELWASWACQITADYSQSDVPLTEQEALFENGYKLSQELISNIETGKMSAESISQLPTGISLTLKGGGPSSEFIIGRIYSVIASDTVDKLFDHPDFLSVEAFAEDQYREQNCAILASKVSE